jgi:hypothetical protein
VRTIVEVPPKRDTGVVVPPGHMRWNQECVACRRDFRVYVPTSSSVLAGLTLDVPCPHCHRHKAEVLISPVSGPILVEASERTWLEWRMRRARQVVGVAGRTIVIRTGQVARGVRRLFGVVGGGEKQDPPPHDTSSPGKR